MTDNRDIENGHLSANVKVRFRLIMHISNGVQAT